MVNRKCTKYNYPFYTWKDDKLQLPHRNIQTWFQNKRNIAKGPHRSLLENGKLLTKLDIVIALQQPIEAVTDFSLAKMPHA